MRVAIVGSREYPHPEHIEDAVLWLQANVADLTLISGGARGVDRWAREAAEKHGVRLHEEPANWTDGGAGRRRNRIVVAMSDLVICFWDGKSPGTLNVQRVAKELGKPVWLITAECT